MLIYTNEEQEIVNNLQSKIKTLTGDIDPLHVEKRKELRAELGELYEIALKRFNDEQAKVELGKTLTLTEQRTQILTAPESEWRKVLELHHPGADQVLWARQRASYSPEAEAKAAARIEKRKKSRKAYARNGRTLYPKQDNNAQSFWK